MARQKGVRILLRDRYHRNHVAEILDEYLALKKFVADNADTLEEMVNGEGEILDPLGGRDRKFIKSIIVELGGTGDDEDDE
jgi:Mg2+/Co2+ transporter CorC